MEPTENYFADKEEDIIYFFQAATDNGYIINVDTKPKKKFLGGISSVLTISIFKENDDNGNYWKWSSSNRQNIETSNSILKALNPIDTKVYTDILESYDRLKDIIDFKRYSVEILVFGRYLHQQTSEHGTKLNSFGGGIVHKIFTNTMPPRIPPISPNRQEATLCCAVEFHVKPLKIETPSKIANWKNFFN